MHNLMFHFFITDCCVVYVIRAVLPAIIWVLFLQLYTL